MKADALEELIASYAPRQPAAGKVEDATSGMPEKGEQTIADIDASPKKKLAETWWRTEYDILGMAQTAGDSLRRNGKRTSNRAIGNAIALEIERRENAGKKRKGPDGMTIKNTDLAGWEYVAE